MTDMVLKSRAVPARPAADADTALDVMLRRAQTVARAGDAIPRGYRNNPGAVLLAGEWAAARGLDLLTAIQSVAFIDGKPVIDATMQRALAKRAGYRVLVTHADDRSATVAVLEGGEKLGEATYTMDDAKHAGLAGKSNWRQHPKAMLVARATTQAMRWFAPDVMVGVVTVEEASAFDGEPVRYEPEPLPPDRADEPVDVEPVEVEPVEVEQADAEPVDVEPVDLEPGDTPAGPKTRGRAKAAIETAKTHGVWPDVVNTLNEQGIPIRVASLTEQQATTMVDIIDRTVAAAAGDAS